MPGLTTTRHSDWRHKIEEIKEYNIKNISLFLTGIDKKERIELYDLLKETNVTEIYHIHLRNDMSIKEIQYLINNYNTKVFNIHSQRAKHPFKHFPAKYKNMTYIENTLTVPKLEEVGEYAGLCVDFAHWEAFKITRFLEYSRFKTLINNSSIGCCHVSAIQYKFGIFAKDTHIFQNFNDLNYLKNIENFYQNI